MQDLEELNLAELKTLAKENNIKNISKLKKDELITILHQILQQEPRSEIAEENSETIEDKENNKQHYDENGEPIVDYKLTNQGDEIAEGILEILPDGYGFLRGENYLSSDKDVYISMVQIRRFRLDTGDIIKGISRYREGEKFPSLILVGEVNGEHPEKAMKRKRFDELTPIYPTEKLKLETTPNDYATSIIDLMCPIGKGQRGMIVAPPKVRKTTLLKMILNKEEGIEISPKVQIGYFAQNGYKFEKEQNVLEFLRKASDYSISEIRSMIAMLGIKQNVITREMKTLSGGEVIKILLCKLLLGRYNVLIKDEPNNYLDIQSIVALESLMQQYRGTIIFVSHDKRLVENVADIIYEIQDNKIIEKT